MEKIIFLPIDIDINLSEFNRTNTEKKVLLNAYQPFWDTVSLDSVSLSENNIRKIYDQLPYSKISFVLHKFQTREVRPHFDVYLNSKFIEEEELNNIQENEPCGYRLVLKGSTDALEVFDGENWICPTLPSVPCCYLIDSTRLKHRVKNDPGRELLYFRGLIDKTKHLKLIEKSMKKYGDKAIYLKKEISSKIDNIGMYIR